MFSSAALKFIGKVLIFVLAVFGAYLAYRYVTSEGPPPPFNNYQEHVIELAAGQLTAEVAGTTEKPRKLLLPRITGDATGRITYVIKDSLERSGRAEILEPKFTEDAGQSVKDWFFSAIRSIVKPQEAREIAERSRADAILVPEVMKFDDTSEEAILKLHYTLHDSRTMEAVTGEVEGRLVKSIFSLTYLQLWMCGRSRWVRGLIWFLVTLLLPLVTCKFAWSVMAKKRNDYNALLIAGYTVVDTLLVWILLGFSLGGLVTSSLFILALVGSATWNFLILDELEDMRH